MSLEESLSRDSYRLLVDLYNKQRRGVAHVSGHYVEQQFENAELRNMEILGWISYNEQGITILEAGCQIIYHRTILLESKIDSQT